MKLIFLIAVLVTPGGENYQEHVQSFDQDRRACEAARVNLEAKAKAMVGFGFNARCVEVTFGPSA